MRFALLFFIGIAGLVSCKKDTSPVSKIWECNTVQSLDSIAISNKLVGSWLWTKQSCYWEGTVKSADRNIKATFNNDFTFSVNENSVVLTQGTWRLVQIFGNHWELDVSLPSIYLYGYILFCNDQVLFNHSYIDGCDNLFSRIK
jgi:hypothetical protein